MNDILRRGKGVVSVKSGSVSIFKVSTLSALNAQKESHRSFDKGMMDHIHHNSKMPLMIQNPNNRWQSLSTPLSSVAEKPQDKVEASY